jgi:hypothetical protein
LATSNKRPWASILVATVSLGASACVLAQPQTDFLPPSTPPPHHAARPANKLSQSDHLEYIKSSIASFKNKTLVVAIIIREPFVMFNEPPGWSQMSEREQQLARQELANYSGIAIEVVKRLKAIFKFGTRLTSPADNQFGVYSQENGTWNGLLGQLVRAEVDVAVTALSLTVTRGGCPLSVGR